MNRVRLTKLTTVQSPLGERTIPEGYWVEGVLAWEPTVGRHLYLFRDRNSKDGNRTGYLRTSNVQKIEGNKIFTQNSVWQITPADENLQESKA